VQHTGNVSKVRSPSHCCTGNDCCLCDAITSQNGNDTLKKLFCMHKWTAMGFDITPAAWNCSTLHSVINGTYKRTDNTITNSAASGQYGCNMLAFLNHFKSEVGSNNEQQCIYEASLPTGMYIWSLTTYRYVYTCTDMVCNICLRTNVNISETLLQQWTCMFLQTSL
jgi:hypothetical protein